MFDISDVIERQRAARMKKKRSSASVFKDIFNKINTFLITHSKVNLKDKVAFFQLLSVMINAGVPLVKALAVLGDQFTNEGFKKTIREMSSHVDRGKSLSEAMGEFSRVFGEAQVGMVEAAEASGQMNEVLHQLAAEMEKSQSIVSKVRGALIYPMMVLLVLGGAIVAVMVLVIPKLKGLFTKQGMELPLPTRVLIATSDFFVHYWVMIVMAVVGFVFFLMYWKKTETGGYYWGKFVLRLPIFGDLIKKVALSRFTRTLANLLQSGIPIVKALGINANAVGNPVYRRRIMAAADDVQRGIPLGENLSDSHQLFPPTLIHMIIVGEQTAQLDVVANKIADFYDEEIDIKVKTLSKVMEPMIMIVVGLGVAGIVAAIMMPMMQMTDLSALG